LVLGVEQQSDNDAGVSIVIGAGCSGSLV